MAGLHPPSTRAFERILSMGGPGSGKTRQWMDIALRAHKTGSDARFRCLDTDFTVDRMLSGERFAGLHVDDGGNIEHTLVDSYDVLMDGLKGYRAITRPQDWLIVDMMSFVWPAVQGYYTAQVFGEELGSFFLAAREAEKDREFEGWTDWKVINKLYQDFTGPLYRLQGHLFATASIDKTGDKDDEAVKRMFGKFGVKPVGQKHSGHLFHTILWSFPESTKAGEEWHVTSVKDRERKMLVDQKWTDFSVDYLVRVGGWKLS